MDSGDWDLSSIVRSCKATTFSDPSTIDETPPLNLTTTITPATNNIASPIKTTPSCFGDFIFNQEISLAADTYTMDNDWDLSSIVRSCKATTFTNPSTLFEPPPQNLITTVTTTTTNSHVSPVNLTPSCFADVTFNQENSPISITPLKPNDFIDLNKLRANFNSNTHIPTPTTTNIPITGTTTTSSLTTTTFSTHITPNVITNINPSGLVSNKNPTFFDFSTSIKQHQMLPNVFTTPTTTISTQAITPTYSQQQNLQIEGKNKNLETSVCYVKEDKLSNDQWQWRKYGQKPIKGSSLHSRSYYKCSSFQDCPARKLIEKSKTEENTYVVTYRGKHDHRKPEVKKNSNIGTSRNKSSEARLSVVEQAGSSQNFKNSSSPNVVMMQFDQSESNNAPVLDSRSKISNESQSHVVREAGSSQEGSKTQMFHGETEFIGSYNDDDDGILIPNMSSMSENYLLEYNHLDGGFVLP